jgi:signal transduction histidine kinase
MAAMTQPPLLPPPAPPHRRDRSLWLGYAGLCLLAWVLYGVAGTDWQRGGLRTFDALYEATWNLAPGMLLGALVLPWARRLQRLAPPWPLRAALHVLGAAVFAVLWHAMDFALSWWFFGPDHAWATLAQQLLWRSAWAVFVYLAIYLGFSGALHAHRARDAAVSAAQAESALVRAELAVISGKLNPHFLFNTLNSIHFLMRRDTPAAEQALLGFARMMRYLLDTRRGAADRVPLREELDFVRDYLALESLRLGTRLQVQWAVDETALDDEIPPLTLQPLVENAIAHGIAPRVEGGTVRIEARRTEGDGTLSLQVADDGAGCDWPPAASGPGGRGVGLHSLMRRFEMDYEGRARLDVSTAPGAGFRVHIVIPQLELHP